MAGCSCCAGASATTTSSARRSRRILDRVRPAGEIRQAGIVFAVAAGLALLSCRTSLAPNQAGHGGSGVGTGGSTAGTTGVAGADAAGTSGGGMGGTYGGGGSGWPFGGTVGTLVSCDSFGGAGGGVVLAGQGGAGGLMTSCDGRTGELCNPCSSAPGGDGGGSGAGGRGGAGGAPTPLACVGICKWDGIPYCEACGRPGFSCCPGNACEGNGCCVSGTCYAEGAGCPFANNGTCCGGRCVGCGAVGEACCPYNYPMPGSNPCQDGAACDATTNRCGTCGGSGEVCCPGNSCLDGGCCVYHESTQYSAGQGYCVANADACGGSLGQCQAGSCGSCGGLGQPCCQNTPSAGSWCSAGLWVDCMSGSDDAGAACAACGDVNQARCGSGPSCRPGLVPTTVYPPVCVPPPQMSLSDR